MELKGKTILITGGTAGIGLQAAKQFSEAGCKVVITGRSQGKLDEAKKALPMVTAIKSDIANATDALSLFKQVKAMGGIDILYNNAGILHVSKNLGMANDDHLQAATQEMDVNYLGVIRLNNLFMDMLKSRKEGAIINTTSILSYVPSLIEATYSASKTALGFYTQALRQHLSIINSKLKVFELLPPVVATEMTAGRNSKKLSSEDLVKSLIAGLKKDQYTIRVGDTKIIYIINRIFPKLAFGFVNSKKDQQQLQS